MTDDTDGVLAQAREHLDAGQPWRARDLLVEHLGDDRDDEALRMLGHVHHGMGDLPRAGAAWFAVGVKGPEADEAVSAWREQSRDDFAVMWRSLPAAYRREPRAPRVEALRARALATDPDLEKPETPLLPHVAPSDDGGKTAPLDDPEDAGTDAAQVIGWIVGALFVVCAVIGFVTVLEWVVPT